MPALYDRIASLCQKNKTSMTAMCSALQISRASMTDFKNGRSHSLSTDAVAKIAEYFHVSMEYLLSGESTSGARIPLYHDALELETGITPDKLFWSCSDPENCFAYHLRPEDTAMVPRLVPGDLVIIRRCPPGKPQSFSGQWVLAKLPSGLLRLGAALTVPGGLVLSAQNPSCMPCWYPVSAEENRQETISVLGAVIGMTASFEA